MDSLDRLIQLFERFPGIGPRQARRFAQYLLAAPSSSRSELSELIKRVGAETKQCACCFRWFVKNGSTAERCPICLDSSRDVSTLFVVEKDADLDQVERSGFKGLYFCLGGTSPLGSEDPEKHIRARELLKRVEADAQSGTLKELILGLSATTEGDHTREILHEKLRPLAEARHFTISSLGRGLSTGSELEYADPDTIAQALGNRH